MQTLITLADFSADLVGGIDVETVLTTVAPIAAAIIAAGVAYRLIKRFAR